MRLEREAGPGHKTGGWWSSLVGARCADRYGHLLRRVCQRPGVGVPGNNRTFQSVSPIRNRGGSRFPVITIADMVWVEYQLMQFLGIESYALMLGPSLGGIGGSWNGWFGHPKSSSRRSCSWFDRGGGQCR